MFLQELVTLVLGLCIIKAEDSLEEHLDPVRESISSLQQTETKGKRLDTDNDFLPEEATYRQISGWAGQQMQNNQAGLSFIWSSFAIPINEEIDGERTLFLVFYRICISNVYHIYYIIHNIIYPNILFLYYLYPQVSSIHLSEPSCRTEILTVFKKIIKGPRTSYLQSS